MNINGSESLPINPVLFHTADYVIFGAFALIPLAFGIYFTFFIKKENTTSEYFVGSRNVSGFLITVSILATFASSITYIGLPTEIYMYGVDWWYILIGIALGMPFVAHSIVPVFYKLGCTSVFEYIERRFNRKIRTMIALTFTVYSLIRLSFVIYGPGLAISQITGIHVWGAISVVIISAVIYTFLGGIKAVMWLDCIQLILMFVSILSSNIKGLVDVGGINYVLNISQEGNRMHSLSFSFDPHIRYTFWNLLIHGWLLCVSSFGIAHHQVQRYISASSLKTAQRSAWGNLLGTTFIYTFSCGGGLIIYAKYFSCDPLTSKRISAPDQIVPLFIADTYKNNPGMLGVFGAGIFCGSISASSSLMNSLSAIFVEGYIKRFKRFQYLEEKKITLISKILIIVIGIMALLLVVAAERLGNIHKSFFAFLSFFYGIVTGMFMLGLFCPWVSSLGASIGLVCTYIIGLWITIGIQLNKGLRAKLPISVEGCEEFILRNESISSNELISHDISSNNESIYDISYLWILPICTSITLLVGGISECILNKFLKKESEDETDPQLISPWINFITENANKCKRKKMVRTEDDGQLEMTLEKMINNEEKRDQNAFSTNKPE